MRDVLDNNRRAGVAAAVGLDPAILGESEAVELLREILDHVRAFWFSMDKDVEANSFLDADAIADVFVDFLVVLLFADLSLAELEADGTQLGHLGEAANARGPELRKIQLSCLQSETDLRGVFAREECLGHDDRLVWNAGRGRSLSALGKKHDVCQLLDGKAQSLLELRRERGFRIHVVGQVHQRRRGLHDQGLSKTTLGKLGEDRGSLSEKNKRRQRVYYTGAQLLVLGELPCLDDVEIISGGEIHADLGDGEFANE